MSNKFYPDVNSSPNFPELEQKVLTKWQNGNYFQKSIRGEKSYVFYDGPPFANGLPHYGHLLTGFIKDIFARYHTMLGKKVERRFGWDCHGLPAEMGAEKELGISGKVEIEKFGIDKFNEHCRHSVLKYTKEWEEYVTRQARWVDFTNDYKTMDINYMESVLWAFHTLYQKGLVYQAMRVMPYSWACETPVSDFETRMDNSYREKTSKAITVAFKLASAPKLPKLPQDVDYYMVAWTTTPWTLPSNLALAVGAEIDYAFIKKDDAVYIIAAALAGGYAKELGEDIITSCQGKELIGLKYQPLFDYFATHPNAFVVLPGEFVTTEDGTGIVHIAPGFGEDDQKLCQEHNIELVCPVDNAGKFTHPVADYLGMQVFTANDPIIIKLKQQGSWLRTQQYTHNYPHCWRTDTPLIYKAVPSWYVAVTKIKDKMIENNKQINWIPGHIRDGLFGKWLENARDWSISRNRYWGCPIPIWQSDDPKYPYIEVYGSIAEIEKAFGVEVKDLHRPFIDTLVRPNPNDPTGKSMLRRVPDVLDCWFESGSMPYAQMHYPFENQDHFERNFPADFIVEYLSQTRGWFYTLLVLSTALFDKPPFLNCICHGVILGDGGQKLSKRLKNYADPKEVFQHYGADAMRWYMVSSQVMRAQEIIIDKDAKGIAEVIRLVIKPIWNAYHFFTLYANADGLKAEFSYSSPELLDKYILSRVMQTVAKIKVAMDDYDTPSATAATEAFFEALNNWYIRRNRERFWRSQKDASKQHAYNTLYTVLHLMCRAVSPLLPLITDEIYQGLTAGKDSIHLEDFPNVDNNVINENLVQNIERMRDACNAALRLRNEKSIRIRQPLSKVTFIGVGQQFSNAEQQQIILDEINVKSWDNLDKSEIKNYANYKLKINFPLVGKRLALKVKDIIKASQSDQWHLTASGNIMIAGCELLPQEFSLLLEPKTEFKDNICALSSNDALVMLDLEITAELKAEGLARDVIRAVQQARKNAGLQITDKIILCLQTDALELSSAISAWQHYIKEQTLTKEIITAAADKAYQEEVEIEGMRLLIIF
jgi:isoleucyl-tRNA synthetase